MRLKKMICIFFLFYENNNTNNKFSTIFAQFMK